MFNQPVREARLTSASFETAPDPTNYAAWKEIPAGSLYLYRDCDILEALDIYRNQDRDLAKRLQDHLFKRIHLLLRKRFGDPNHAAFLDLLEDLKQLVRIKAMGKDGINLRKNFVKTIDFKALTVWRELDRHEIVPLDTVEAFHFDLHHVDRAVDIARATDRYSQGNPRKVDLIRLKLAGFSSAEIEAEIGISDRSQRRWMVEFYEKLMKTESN